MCAADKKGDALSRCFGVYDHAEHGIVTGQLLVPLHATFVVACLAKRNNVGSISEWKMWQTSRIITDVLWKTNIATNNRLSAYASKIPI